MNPVYILNAYSWLYCELFIISALVTNHRNNLSESINCFSSETLFPFH